MAMQTVGDGLTFKGLRGELLLNEPMSRHTTWRVGGPAERYYKPVDMDDLACYLGQLPEAEPIFWLGLGSNLLVRDGGIRGSVIAYFGGLNALERDGTQVRVEAGVACGKVARFCSQRSLVGAEFLAGIPGAMGGALAMNAGAFGGETWDLVEQVEVMDRHGKRHIRKAEEYQVGYRWVQRPLEQDEWFVAVWLRLREGNSSEASMRIRALLDRRSQTQPTQQPNAGSVFRNPEGDYAARLIELCGLKGYRIGGAQVSEKHANFIVNLGDATAGDIEQLIAKIQATVKQQHGIELMREVRIAGEQ